MKTVTRIPRRSSLVVVFPFCVIISTLSPAQRCCGDDPLDSWSPRNPGANFPLFSVAYAQNQFVAAGFDGGTIMTSPDSVTWSTNVSGFPSERFLTDVAFGNGLWIAVGGQFLPPTSDIVGFNDNPGVASSTNGVTWAVSSAGADFLPAAIAYGDGRFVAVGNVIDASQQGTHSGAAVSTNAVTWTLGNPAITTSALNGLAFGNGIFVAVGDAGSIFSSPDGLVWTRRDSGTTAYLSGVAHGDGQFVAVACAGSPTVLTSPDGFAWHPQNISTSFLGIAYGSAQYVAVGLRGSICSSSNGISWTPHNSGTNADLYGIAFGGGRFVAVGGRLSFAATYGTILQSGKFEPIQPTRPWLSDWSHLADVSFQFTIHGETNHSYTLQMSTNLVDWASVGTLITVNGTLTLVDPTAADFSRLFYRVVVP